jgi:hypothetical protein
MAFEGGPLNVIGITPAFLSQLGTQTAQNGVVQGLGQVWAGAGQTFAGSAGQSLAGNLAGSAVNVALNSLLGTQVTGPQGLSLTSGANLLASTITPYVTGNVAAGINQSIQKSLQSAGPFGPALSTLGTGLVNQAFGGITDSIFGAASPGSGENYKMFPGGGGEPPADYGGSSYTLNDVVFSIQPANQGPQAFGLDQATTFPKSITTLPFNDLASMPPLAPNATANAIKSASMSNAVGTRAFSPNFNPSGITRSSFNAR